MFLRGDCCLALLSCRDARRRQISLAQWLASMHTPLSPTAGDMPLDIQALEVRCLGRLDLVERVLQTFNDQLDADLAKLEQALAAGNIDEFTLVAHRIKGMSANTEARELAREAAITEQKARDGAFVELPEHVERLRTNRARIAVAFASRSRAF
jgi:HPt (histidine-containing phosphotransfer) domain-containing protein